MIKKLKTSWSDTDYDIKYDDESKTLYIGKNVDVYVFVSMLDTKYIWEIFDENDYRYDKLIDGNGNYIANLDVEHVVVDKGNELVKIIDGCLIRNNKTLWVPENHSLPEDEKYTITFFDENALAEKNYGTLIMKTDDAALMMHGRMRDINLDVFRNANSIKRLIFPININDIKTAENINNYEIKAKTNEPEILLCIGTIKENGKLNELCESEDFNKLYENSVNEGKISDFIDKVFSGCRTKEDKTKRLIKLVSSGVISLSIAFWLVGTSITQNKAESEQIKKELVEVSSDGDKSSQNERKQSKYGNFNNDVEFGKAWKASEAGIEHIRNTEKYSSKPYYATDDEKARGILTIGYGHTIKKDDPDWVKNAKYMSKEDAEKLLRLDIEYFEIRFENSVVPNFDKRLQNPETMPQAVIDVMISLAYNAGIAGFKREERNPFYASLKQCRYDSITGKINKQDYDFTISKLPKSLIWQGKKELQGLINRRNAEYKYAKV